MSSHDTPCWHQRCRPKLGGVRKKSRDAAQRETIEEAVRVLAQRFGSDT